ncbi:MAG: hypothetical protein WBK88_03355 [Methanothrix sp.]
MAYVKIDWTEETPITAARLNLMETQYDEFDASYAVHDHDDRYYTKVAADARFFHAGNDGVGSGLDAWLLDGYSPADIEAAAIPPGSIGIWPGSVESVPGGFHVCNGQNGTPDLRDRMVVGAGDAYARGAMGGYATRTPTGTVTVAGHALTVAQIPAHLHSYTDYYCNVADASSGGGISISGNYTDANRNTATDGGSGAAHGHPGSTISFAAYDNLPLYRALLWIMRAVS